MFVSVWLYGQAGTLLDTLYISPGDEILNGEAIKDYTNKWKVTYYDSEGNETPNRIWTDYGQIMELEGKRYFHRVQDLYSPEMVLQDTWINMVSYPSLVPVSFSSLKPDGSFTYLSFKGSEVTGSSNQVKPGEKSNVNSELTKEVFDWNLYGILLVGLPLKDGLIASLPFYSMQTGEVEELIVEVIGTETMKIPNLKSYNTWKIQTNQNLLFWISKKVPYVLRLELKLQNGGKLIWEVI